MYLGLFGTYRKNETVDVEYQLDGRAEARVGRRDHPRRADDARSVVGRYYAAVADLRRMRRTRCARCCTRSWP